MDLSKLNKHDFALLQCEWYNAEEGNLHLDDGIICPICKNKGRIAFLSATDCQLEKDCQCMKQRRTMLQLKSCGITKEVLEKNSFTNFNAQTDWQKQFKNTAIEYYKEILNGGKNWYYIGANSGIGKSHICTAIFQNIIRKSNVGGYYLTWSEFVPPMIALSKSPVDDSQTKYLNKLKLVQEVDILYIDDFMKLTKSKYNNDSLLLAFEILDYRYRNNKVTIISSEYKPEQLGAMDIAIMGRIREKCDFGKYMVTYNGENFRLG